MNKLRNVNNRMYNIKDETNKKIRRGPFDINILWSKNKKKRKIKEVIRKILFLGRNPNSISPDRWIWMTLSFRIVCAVLGMIPIYFAMVHQATLLKKILQKCHLFYVSFHIDVDAGAAVADVVVAVVYIYRLSV